MASRSIASDAWYWLFSTDRSIGGASLIGSIVHRGSLDRERNGGDEQSKSRCRLRRSYLGLNDQLVSICRQCTVGPVVPSDQVPAKNMKMVTRSCGSFEAITGEPGRLAPQLFTASPETKNMRWGCQCMSSSLRYCCFAIM